MTNVIAELGTAIKRDDVPDFRAGDTIKVHVKVVEGNRSRVQVFQGVVIRVQGAGIGRTFTVRKVSFGVGVERTFPINSPIFEKIEVVTRGDVRRAKLYYLRNLRGKAAPSDGGGPGDRRRRRCHEARAPAARTGRGPTPGMGVPEPGVLGPRWRARAARRHPRSGQGTRAEAG